MPIRSLSSSLLTTERELAGLADIVSKELSIYILSRLLSGLSVCLFTTWPSPTVSNKFLHVLVNMQCYCTKCA